MLTWRQDCVFARLRTLKNEVERTKAKEHAYPAPRVIYSAIIAVLAALEQELKQLLDAFPDPVRQRQHLETAADQLSRIRATFSLVARVDSSRIPFEVLGTLEWVATYLLNPQSLEGGEDPLEYTIVVRLDPDDTYSIVSANRAFADQHWEQELEEAAKGAGIAVRGLLLLGFPSAEAKSTLLHALASHELGHELRERIRADYDQTFKSVYGPLMEGYRPAFRGHLEGKTRNIPAESRSDSYETERKVLIARLEGVVKLWAEEVFCDLLGAHLIGPAYLAALNRVILRTHTASDSHPASPFRANLVRRYILQHCPGFASDPAWADLMNDTVDESKTHDIVEQFAYEFCEKVSPQFAVLLARVSSPFHPKFVTKVDPAELCDRIQEQLMNLSPPNAALPHGTAWESPVGLWLIMYSAWRLRVNRAKFQEFGELVKWDSRPQAAEEALDALVLQGIYALELRARKSLNDRTIV